MSQTLSTAVASIAPSPTPQLLASHRDPTRVRAYASIAQDLKEARVPVDHSDCAACDLPCPVDDSAKKNGYTGKLNAGAAWDGKTYEQYVVDEYGDMGVLPSGFEQDWESELMGSGHPPPEGRVVVFATGKSDWEKDHLNETQGLAHKLDQHLSGLDLPPHPGHEGRVGSRDVQAAIKPAIDLDSSALVPPDLHSCSMFSQSDDPEVVSVLIFPDWKVVHGVENSLEGAANLYENVLRAGIGRAGSRLQEDAVAGATRIRSWVLPYRAIILLCSHKRRDKRCSIAAPLLRSALITCLERYDISVDGTGEALSHSDGKALEMTHGTPEEREEEAERQVLAIEGVKGGPGGQVGIFNTNHIGQHKFSGVMLIMFPSGAYLSYGRVSPGEIPRVVEETILQGKVVPGLLRTAVGVKREGKVHGEGFLGW